MVRGETDVCLVDETTGIWSPPLFTRKNQVMYGWGFIVAQCMGVGNLAYKVAAGYLEYKNVVNPTDPVPVPTFLRSDGLSYFQSLPANQDYLRVPLAATPTIDIQPGYEPYFLAGFSGNRLTFKIQSSGSVGVNGVPYSNASNSKVFGLTLVATPVLSDPTKDVILSRNYFNVADQQLKQQGSQIGVNWRIAFE